MHAVTPHNEKQKRKEPGEPCDCHLPTSAAPGPGETNHQRRGRLGLSESESDDPPGAGRRRNLSVKFRVITHRDWQLELEVQ